MQRRQCRQKRSDERAYIFDFIGVRQDEYNRAGQCTWIVLMLISPIGYK